jgi:phosphoglycolate phosphatase-like HAD superfamily hydrolase
MRFAIAPTSSLRIMSYPLVIFDLDGTLADIFPWFQRNVNGVADKFSFRRIQGSGHRSVARSRISRNPWES